MGRQRHFEGLGELACVFLLEYVAQLHLAGKVDGAERHHDGLVLVVGVIDGEGTLVAVEHLQVLYQQMAAVDESCHVGLLEERVLVQGDQLLVSEQGECRGLDVSHVAADEQG